MFYNSKSESSTATFRQAIGILSKSDRRKLGIVTVIQVFLGILDLFGFKLDGVGDFADQAWFIWSAITCFNSFSRLRWELGKRGERDEEKMRMEIILFLKLFCELGDCVIALTPKGMKKSQGWVVASASLGSISALCSLYKFFYPYFSISFLDDDT